MKDTRQNILSAFKEWYFSGDLSVISSEMEVPWLKVYTVACLYGNSITREYLYCNL